MGNRTFIVGGVLFTLVAIILTISIQDLPETTTILALDRTSWLSIMTSVAASGTFLVAVEVYRALADRHAREQAARLHRLEVELGIRDVFSSKSDGNIIAAYKVAMANARSRVWAMGLSNNQFLEQHSATLKARRRLHPNLDIRLYFFDPDATVTSAKQAIKSLPLVNLFDFPRSIYKSEKRSADAKNFVEKVQADSELLARVYAVLSSSYFSLMIIDDDAFFFPYLAAPEDASSHPMLMVNTRGEIGRRLVQHVEQLTANVLLCRSLNAQTGAN